MLGFVETPEEIVDIMVDLSGVSKDAMVLDTGFGRGVFLKKLLEKNFKNCWGVEIDKKLFEEAKKQINNKCTLILGDFLEYNFKQKFDLVIGNPPYVHYRKLPQNIKPKVREITKSSNSNIYYAFIIKAIDILRDGGVLVYIVPYSFFYNTHARVVREKILESGAVDTIVDLGECRIFKGVQPEVVIIRFVKSAKQNKIKIWRVKSSSIKVAEIRRSWFSDKADAFHGYEIEGFRDVESWGVAEKNNIVGMRLCDVARVGVGPVSGYDKAFEIKNIENLNDKEKKFIKKFIKARNCKRYITEGYVDYVVIDEEVGEEELKKECPSIYSSLLKHKSALESRYIRRGGRWFEWQALRNYKLLKENETQQKIVVPAIDRKKESRFSILPPNTYPAQDTIFILPHNKNDTLFLLGYLNSKTFRKHYEAQGGRRGDRTVFTQRLLANSKIPNVSKKTKTKISKITQKIITNKINNLDVKKLEDEIDRILEKEGEDE